MGYQEEVNELTTKLMSQAGLDKEQAEKALAVIKEHIKEKLPPMMKPMVNKFLGDKD